MKIRIKGNSIRLRMSKSEVERFGKEGYLQESTHFGNATFSYALKQADIANLGADFQDNTITVLVPTDIASEWVSNDIVGFDHHMDLPNGDKLYLLVEKDFKCLDNTHENQDDNYEHPKGVC